LLPDTETLSAKSQHPQAFAALYVTRWGEPYPVEPSCGVLGDATVVERGDWSAVVSHRTDAGRRHPFVEVR
jgi:hypothetical protein